MGEVKRCAACDKENPVSEMKVCMHKQMHRYVCDSKCMTDFYNQPKKPTAAELQARVAELQAENAKLRAELERTATWIEDLPVPTVCAAGQLVRIDKVLAARMERVIDDPVKAQMLEALDTARDYVYSELENRKSALAGHPNKWEKEERDLAQVDAAIAAARKGEEV